MKVQYTHFLAEYCSFIFFMPYMIRFFVITFIFFILKRKDSKANEDCGARKLIIVPVNIELKCAFSNVI